MNTNEFLAAYILAKDLAAITDNMSLAGISSVMVQLLSSWAKEHDMDMTAVKVELIKTI